MSTNTAEDWWADTEEEAPSESTGPLPKGNYVAEVVSIEEKFWDDGTPKVEWTFRVVGGEFDGRTTYMTDKLSPEKRGKTKGHLTLVGIGGANWGEVKSRLGSARGVRVKISRSEYSGKLYTFLNGLADGAPAPAPAPAAPKQPDLPGTPPAASLYD